MDTNDLTRPATWRESLLPLGPFLFVPVVFMLALLFTPLLETANEGYIPFAITLVLIGVFLVLMVKGWAKDFPRWVFPYWGFILLVTFYVANFTGTMAGHDVTGDWWAWIPLIGVGVSGSIWARGFRPLRVLFKSLWKDWTLLSFAFYGALPLLFFAAYDEVHNEAPILSGIMVVLAAGMIFYIRTETLWHRLASLVGGFTIGWTILMIHQGIYWNGRQEAWMQRPGTWTETLAWTSGFGATLMLFLVAPILIEILRQVAKSGQKPKTVG